MAGRGGARRFAAAVLPTITPGAPMPLQVPQFPTGVTAGAVADDPARQAVEAHLEHLVALALDRAAATAADPAAFPPSAASLDAALLDHVRALSPARREAVSAAAVERLQRPANERAQLYGALAAVDVRSGQPLLDLART